MYFKLIFVIFTVAILFFKNAYSEEVKNDFYSNSSLCGLEIFIPKELKSLGDEVSLCIGSYKGKEGAVITLVPSRYQGSGPSWIERQPILHVYQVSVADLLAEGKSQRTNFRMMSNGVVVDRNPIRSCGVQAETKMLQLEGENWKGWLAEDSYNEQEIEKSKEEYCQEFKKINKCVRLVIGNEKISATMNQYCLTKNSEDFDLDDRLSFKIFMEMILSIIFVEN